MICEAIVLAGDLIAACWQPSPATDVSYLLPTACLVLLAPGAQPDAAIVAGWSWHALAQHHWLQMWMQLAAQSCCCPRLTHLPQVSTRPVPRESQAQAMESNNCKPPANALAQHPDQPPPDQQDESGTSGPWHTRQQGCEETWSRRCRARQACSPACQRASAASVRTAPGGAVQHPALTHRPACPRCAASGPAGWPCPGPILAPLARAHCRPGGSSMCSAHAGASGP